MAVHRAVPRVIACDNAYGIELNAQLLEHELHLEQLTELEENALAPMRNVSEPPNGEDRKSTRLNSSHSQISYAVFCLKKKNAILYLRQARNYADRDWRHNHRYCQSSPSRNQII